MAKKKYYVVWEGKIRGIFDNWEECHDSVRAFPDAKYKSFPDKATAIDAYRKEYREFLGKNFNKKPVSEYQKRFSGKPYPETLSVDAACSGNPGKLEYRGVDTKSGIQIFRSKLYPLGTVNLGEFLALVHGIAYLKQKNSSIPIYSDSRTAMKWVRDKKIKTTLQRNSKTEELFHKIDRAIFWLENNSYPNKILKWETAIWGEIPADFGRK
ncbi:MAG: ribonuclease H family protein [Bacteroidales bacterium]|nr:ribonuclease H family protein [Bacteroidales bacterium]